MPKNPVLNIELFVDNIEFKTFHSIRTEFSINGLATFTLQFGDPYKIMRRIRTGSDFKLYISWGDSTPQEYFHGTVTRESRNIASGQSKVVVSGFDLGILMKDKQAWDSEFYSLKYRNMKASEIISNLLGNVDGISSKIHPHEDEPTLDWTCTTGTNILENFRRVCAYGGYEWYVDFGGSIVVRKETEATSENAKYNLIVGKYDDFVSLPVLPYAYIHKTTLMKDNTNIKNFYKVIGEDGVFGTGFNQFSINKLGRKSEAVYKDESLTTAHSCEIAATSLAMINGDAKIRAPITMQGMTELKVGDIVYVNDLNRNIFSSLDENDRYLKISEITSDISKSGWKSELTLGRPRPELSDVIQQLMK
jgi:hypothetical protein